MYGYNRSDYRTKNFEEEVVHVLRISPYGVNPQHTTVHNINIQVYVRYARYVRARVRLNWPRSRHCLVFDVRQWRTHTVVVPTRCFSICVLCSTRIKINHLLWEPAGSINRITLNRVHTIFMCLIWVPAIILMSL